MRTYTTKASDIQQSWHVIDAAGQPLGRLASQVAVLLIGKHKPTYSPHMNMGDYVIVVNAAKVKVTGDKMEQKNYYRHSGYPGGLRTTTLTRVLATHPTRAIAQAVKGMLPHNTLGRAMLRRLKVYADGTHPHEAQVGAGGTKKEE